MKIVPVLAKGIEVGFSIEAETQTDQNLLDVLTSKGEHWKGWQLEPGKLFVYPDPTLAPNSTVH